MKISCPICGEIVKFDSSTPKDVIELFKEIGCPSLQFDHKEKKGGDENMK